MTRNQRRGFLAAWAGWALDGMDSFIYALVMVPALRELLPKSGHAATTANIGYYGSLLFALFLVGWGFSFVWGPLADRFGRVRTLMLTILLLLAVHVRRSHRRRRLAACDFPLHRRDRQSEVSGLSAVLSSQKSGRRSGAKWAQG